ncbi:MULTISPECIES: hypothetical protein [Paracoccus]|uniref:Flagellar basal body-associated protein FliL n=1 Tax=Paracoccus hibiscisoli TaxID=2023261 RepID=A0A4V5MUJ0_9RHOB|nr:MULTISPECIES: hypothetical protein [Paracoccus]TJZ87938.1 hypothetical protein FA740_00340 [Paracoccus hibiscisoli]
MIRKIIPLALPVLALVGGAVAGDMLRAPAPDAAASEHAGTPEAAGDGHGAAPGGHDAAPAGEAAWFQFPTQFFVPLVRQGDLQDVMILTLTMQTDSTSLGALAKKEHSLRDAMLRALMIHANTGGFDGNFTADRNLATLREGLLRAARAATDLPVSAVLIEDIVRQPG